MNWLFIFWRKKVKMEIDEYLEQKYEEVVSRAIGLKLIKRSEWDERFKDYRDEAGHSFVHYLECIMNKIDIFLTLNPIMIKNREELEKRFGVKIRNPRELTKELENKK